MYQGCLFERKLCTRDQFCSDDGLFGQCRSSKQDLVQYQVTVPVLKRMQEVLKQLMLQGLSWQDDITQYILSKELKRVPHTTLPSKPNSSSPSSHSSQYQDEAERSLIGAVGGYARPSSRSQANQRERERDRQLLQEALSLYLASAQPSYRHRGAASMASAVSEKNFLESETGLKIVQTGVGEELCRQHMASKSSLCRQDCVGGVSSSMAGSAIATGAGGRRGTDTSRVSSVSSQFSDGPQHSPSSTHSSTPSWSEEPAQSNMDISTGHMILAYMEDHLRNKDRLQKEWEALCSYQAEPSSVAVAQAPSNMDKNRQAEALPYDHSRVKLKTELNPNKQDYINASIISDHDPRQPAYIATQGPLPHTVADFWQMVWENGCTVIVMMTALVEDGEKQCERYWPDEGSSLYHIYEVNKCYRGRSCPIIVHCGDGTGRTGTYILIDMVLNRMAKGVKEIDIAAALEHIRDQRPGLVCTKDQFEFALTAVAEEVNAILKALPQ
eukprot:superscaffoldBa00000108_g1572